MKHKDSGWFKTVANGTHRGEDRTVPTLDVASNRRLSGWNAYQNGPRGNPSDSNCELVYNLIISLPLCNFLPSTELIIGNSVCRYNSVATYMLMVNKVLWNLCWRKCLLKVKQLFRWSDQSSFRNYFYWRDTLICLIPLFVWYFKRNQLRNSNIYET